MICAGLFDILCLGGTLDENSCIVCAFAIRAVVTLYSTQITLMFIMLIDTSDSCLRGICFDENLSSDPILLGLPKFILYAYLIYQVYKYEMTIFFPQKKR